MDAYEREEYKLNRKQQADKEYFLNLRSDSCENCEHLKREDLYCQFYHVKLFVQDGVIIPHAFCDEDVAQEISYGNDEPRQLRVKYTGNSCVSLTNGKEYEVLAIEDGWYRIIDDTGEDYLFSPDELKGV